MLQILPSSHPSKGLLAAVEEAASTVLDANAHYSAFFILSAKSHEKTKTNNEMFLLTSFTCVVKAWFISFVCAHRAPL